MCKSFKTYLRFAGFALLFGFLSIFGTVNLNNDVSALSSKPQVNIQKLPDKFQSILTENNIDRYIAYTFDDKDQVVFIGAPSSCYYLDLEMADGGYDVLFKNHNSDCRRLYYLSVSDFDSLNNINNIDDFGSLYIGSYSTVALSWADSIYANSNSIKVVSVSYNSNIWSVDFPDPPSGEIDIIGGLGKIISDLFKFWTEAFMDFLRDPLGNIVDGIMGIPKIIGDCFDALTSLLVGTFNGITATLSTIANAIAEIPNAIMGILEAAFVPDPAVMKTIFDSMLRTISNKLGILMYPFEFLTKLAQIIVPSQVYCKADRRDLFLPDSWNYVGWFIEVDICFLKETMWLQLARVLTLGFIGWVLISGFYKKFGDVISGEMNNDN